MAKLKEQMNKNDSGNSSETAIEKVDLNTLTIKELKTKLDSLKVTYKKSEKKGYYVDLINESSTIISKSKTVLKEKTTVPSKAKESETEKKSEKKEKVLIKAASSTDIISEKGTLKKETKKGQPNFIKSSKLESLNTFYSAHGIDRSKITIIMRDAKWLFAYWETGGSLFEKCKSEIENSDGCVKFISLRVINENGHYYDIDIKFGASSFYFEPNLEGNIKVELGLKSQSGRFYSIAISNTLKVSDISSPIEKVADEILWMDSKKETYTEAKEGINTEVIIESLGGVKYIKHIIGSEEFLDVLKENISSVVSSKLVSTIVSSLVSSQSSSENSSYNSSNIVKKNILSSIHNNNEDENDAFWLIADTELILYGATEPDAKLTVAGKNISLNPDGTFFLRMPLPDGDVSLPVEAYSKNGKHYRKIHPQVKKWTQ